MGDFVLEDMELSIGPLLDKFIIMYGTTNCGKTTIISDICSKLADFIDLAIVVSLTDSSNGAYSNPWKNGTPMVHRPYIMTDISESWLETFVRRQEERTALYKKINTKEVLDSLLRKCGRADEIRKIDDIRASKGRIEEALREQFDGGALDDKIASLGFEFERLIRNAYVQHILPNVKRLTKMQLTEIEKLAVQWIGLNPRALIIFDDCSPLVKTISATNIFKQFVTTLRHNYTTCIVAVHNTGFIHDKARDQGHNVFLLKYDAANQYFTRSENKAVDKETRAFNAMLMRNTFTRDKRHQKLWIMPPEMRYGRVTATPVTVPFTLGSDGVRQYARKIEKDEKSTPMTFNYIGGPLKK